MARMPRARSAPLALSTLLALLAATSCAPDDPSPVAVLSHLEGGPIFLVQSEPAPDVMEALFDGPIVVDAAGCLRLDTQGSEDATVVWPHGFTLETDASGYRVLDGEGNTVGVVGERFRLGGGFVSTLHEGIPMDEAARTLATERCSGAYWIVGEVA